MTSDASWFGSMARIGLTWPTFFATILATFAGIAACTSAPDLPPVLGGCDADGDTTCTLSAGAGGVSSPDGGGLTSDGAVFDLDAPSGCGIQTAFAAPNPACMPCLGQFCCSAAAFCAIDPVCTSIVQVCAGCSTGGCTGACGLAEQAASAQSTAAFDDLSGCLTLNCATQCPALNIFQLVIDP